MDLQLKDRVYIVTGGGRGLGRATADALVADGAKVVLSGRGGESLDEARATLGAAAVTVEADNADPDTPQKLIAAARERLRPPGRGADLRRWASGRHRVGHLRRGLGALLRLGVPRGGADRP